MQPSVLSVLSPSSSPRARRTSRESAPETQPRPRLLASPDSCSFRDPVCLLAGVFAALAALAAPRPIHQARPPHALGPYLTSPKPHTAHHGIVAHGLVVTSTRDCCCLPLSAFYIHRSLPPGLLPRAVSLVCRASDSPFIYRPLPAKQRRDR